MRYGLILTLGGAPSVPHRVQIPESEVPNSDGYLPGEYHPTEPVNIDDIPGMTLERARKLSADKTVPLHLVQLDKPAKGEKED